MTECTDNLHTGFTLHIYIVHRDDCNRSNYHNIITDDGRLSNDISFKIRRNTKIYTYYSTEQVCGTLRTNWENVELPQINDCKHSARYLTVWISFSFDNHNSMTLIQVLLRLSIKHRKLSSLHQQRVSVNRSGLMSNLKLSML